MNKNQLLKTLVVANVFLAFASVGAEAFFGWTLPRELADFEHARFTGFSIMSAGGSLQFLLIATSALCAFAAWIGLLTYWRYARPLLLISLSTTLLHVLVAGPSVKTSVSAMLNVMDAVVAGVILGLVYFTELARRFEGEAVAGSASAAASLGANRS